MWVSKVLEFLSCSVSAPRLFHTVLSYSYLYGKVCRGSVCLSLLYMCPSISAPKYVRVCRGLGMYMHMCISMCTWEELRVCCTDSIRRGAFDIEAGGFRWVGLNLRDSKNDNRRAGSACVSLCLFLPLFWCVCTALRDRRYHTSVLSRADLEEGDGHAVRERLQNHGPREARCK